VKLFDWGGDSGPVTIDADGNVFVAAFAPPTSGAAASNPVYGISKAQSFSARPVQPAVLAREEAAGTASIAAVATAGTHKGWLVAKGFDGAMSAPAYAVPYRSTDAGIAADGEIVDAAIRAASVDVSLSFFSDEAGHLWIAAETSSGSTFLELTPRR
jgi:hypothetical protein